MTLSEINITPLLDLAFVLLIIFVITTPLLEQGLDVEAAEGRDSRTSRSTKRISARSRSVRKGIYWLNKRPMTLDQLVAQLVQDFRVNPNLVVYIRADENSRMKDFAALTDACHATASTRYSLAHANPRNADEPPAKEMFRRLDRPAPVAGC